MPLSVTNLEKQNLHSTSTVKLYGCQGEFCENEDEEEDLTPMIPQHCYNINPLTPNFDASLHIILEVQPGSGQSYAKCLQTTSHTEFVGQCSIPAEEFVMGSAMTREKCKETQVIPITNESLNKESPFTQKLFKELAGQCPMSPEKLVSSSPLAYVKFKDTQNYQKLDSVKKLDSESIIPHTPKLFLANNECAPVIENILAAGITTASDQQKRNGVHFKDDDTLKNGTKSATAYPNINTLALSQMLLPDIKRSASSNRTQKDGSKFSDHCSIMNASNNNLFSVQTSMAYITQGRPFQTWYSSFSTTSKLIGSHISIPKASSHSKVYFPDITGNITFHETMSDSGCEESIVYQESNLMALTGDISHHLLYQMVQLRDILGNTIERLVNENPDLLYTGSVSMSSSSKASSKVEDQTQEGSTEDDNTSSEYHQVCCNNIHNNVRNQRFPEDTSTSNTLSERMGTLSETSVEEYTSMVNGTLDDRESVTGSRKGSFIQSENGQGKTKFKNQDATTSRDDKPFAQPSTNIETNSEDTHYPTPCLPSNRTSSLNVQTTGEHTMNSAHINHQTINVSGAPTIVPVRCDKNNISTQDDNVNASTPLCKICENLRNVERNANAYATSTSNSAITSTISQQDSSTSIGCGLKEMHTKVISQGGEIDDLLSSTNQQMVRAQHNKLSDASSVHSTNYGKVSKSNQNSRNSQTGFDKISILCQQNAGILNGMNNTVLIYSAHAPNKLYGARTSNIQIDTLRNFQQHRHITSYISRLCISNSNTLISGKDIFSSSITCMSLPLIKQSYHGLRYRLSEYYKAAMLPREERETDEETNIDLSVVTYNTQQGAKERSQLNKSTSYSFPFIIHNKVIVAPVIVQTEEHYSCPACGTFVDDDDDVPNTSHDLLYKPSVNSMPPCSICLSHPESIRPTPVENKQVNTELETPPTHECHRLSITNRAKELESQYDHSALDLSIVSGRIGQETLSRPSVSSRLSATSDGNDGENTSKMNSSKSSRISETCDEIECEEKFRCISCGSSRIEKISGGIESEKTPRDISGKLPIKSETSNATEGRIKSCCEPSTLETSGDNEGKNNSRCVSHEPSIISETSGGTEEKTKSCCKSYPILKTSGGTDGKNNFRHISYEPAILSETSGDNEGKKNSRCISHEPSKISETSGGTEGKVKFCCKSFTISKTSGGTDGKNNFRHVSYEPPLLSETSGDNEKKKNFRRVSQEPSKSSETCGCTDGKNNSRRVFHQPAILSETSGDKEGIIPYSPSISSLPQNNQSLDVFPSKCSSPHVTPIPVDETPERDIICSDCAKKIGSSLNRKMHLQNSTNDSQKIPNYNVQRVELITHFDSIAGDHSSGRRNKIKVEEAMNGVTRIACNKSLNKTTLNRLEFNEDIKCCSCISNDVTVEAESDQRFIQHTLNNSQENNEDSRSILRKQDAVSTLMEERMFTIPSSYSDYKCIISSRDLTITSMCNLFQCPNERDRTAYLRCHACSLREIPRRTHSLQMLRFPLAELYDLQKELIPYMPTSKISDLVYDLQQELKRYRPILQGEIYDPRKESETFAPTLTRKEKCALQNDLERYKEAFKLLEVGNKLKQELNIDKSSPKLESQVTDSTSSPEKRGGVLLGGKSVDSAEHMREVDTRNTTTRQAIVSENESTYNEANTNIPLSQHFVTIRIKPTHECWNTSKNLDSKLHPAAKRELCQEPPMLQSCSSSRDEMSGPATSHAAQVLSSSEMVASFRRDPHEETPCMQATWALARINVFGDGSRVLEILRTVPAPPEQLTNKGSI